MNKPMKFYNLAARKSFTTSSYKLMKKSGKTMACASTPTGGKAYRLIGKGGM